MTRRRPVIIDIKERDPITPVKSQLERKGGAVTQDDILLIYNQAIGLIKDSFPEMGTAPVREVSKALEDLIKARLIVERGTPIGALVEPMHEHMQMVTDIEKAIEITKSRCHDMTMDNGGGGTKPMSEQRADDIVMAFYEALPDCERFKELVASVKRPGQTR